MDKAVEADKDPNGRRLGLGTPEHRHNSAGMVERLQERGLFALEEDDHGVQDLVVFGEVKDVGPVVKERRPEFGVGVTVLEMNKDWAVRLGKQRREEKIKTHGVLGEPLARKKVEHVRCGVEESDQRKQTQKDV